MVAIFRLENGFKMLRKEANVRIFILDSTKLIKQLNKKERRYLLKKKVYQLLFTYFDIDEKDLKKNSFGKKYISLSDQNKYFNIAYSHQVAVLAISDEEVGIDVEYLKKPVSSHSRSLLNINYNEDDLDFYYKWTCIEASSKLFGIGLVKGFGNIQIASGRRFGCYHRGNFRGNPCYFYSKIFEVYLITICLNTPKVIHFIHKEL